MTENRLRFSVPLEPATGSIFQPTGFPDIGAATFQRPTGNGSTVECLLVESAQSMANHLEGVGWDAARQEPVEVLTGLPWVRVVADNDGRFLTSSRLESHRLASAFVKDSRLDGTEMKEVIRERLELRPDTPLDHRAIARAIFALDPLCLVHGVFFADKEWPGQPKVARAITALVEASDVRAVNSGGVKRDIVLHSAGGGTSAKGGYGSIPFHRQEFTAREIMLHLAIDRLQFRAYGLGDDAAQLLESIAHWEVRSLVEQGLRLRTACDLMVTNDAALAEIPSTEELEAKIRQGVTDCATLLGGGSAIEVRWTRPKGAG